MKARATGEARFNGLRFQQLFFSQGFINMSYFLLNLFYVSEELRRNVSETIQ
jgi:hypothetical protein